MNEEYKKIYISVIILSIVVSSLFGGVIGFWSGVASRNADLSRLGIPNSQNSQTWLGYNEQSSVVSAVEKVSPAVVSIIITKNLPVYERDPFGFDFFRRFFGDDFFGRDFGTQNQAPETQEREIGGGSGFIISSDGYIVTNKHVVADPDADYTVLMNNGKKYPANVIARDTINDMAVIKIEGAGLPTVELGDSSQIKVGQTAVAIGNALGEFRNTVSVGVISGLARNVIAGGGMTSSEQLTNVIQTDASINQGNSGGPLLNLAGQVIGINTAVVQGAQNIGFAIAINEVKGAIDSVRKTGKIVRPWLGVRYVLVSPAMATAQTLPVDYGALITKGQNNEPAVTAGSPAEKAGIKENDIILEVNGKKIDENNPLANSLARFKPGDEVTLKVLSEGKTSDKKVRLEELK